MSAGLARVVVESLRDDPSALAELRELLGLDAAAPAAAAEDPWLDARRAADYAGITLGALYKLKAAGEIPFEQDGPGCKVWFRRSELDAWRRGEWRPSLRSVA